MSALGESIRQKIKDLEPRFPSKQALTLPALHLVQDEKRCVSWDAMKEIADLLDLSPAEVHDTMSFYGFFRTEREPLGKTRLWVCRSLACMLRGGEELLAHVCRTLSVQPGGTTADGKFTVEFAECIGACDGAPAILADDKREICVTPDGAERIIAWLQQLRGTELASPQLIQAVCRKGRTVCYAAEGSEERRYLQRLKANANVGGASHSQMLLQEDARKIEVLEEFLHGTQERIGIGGSFNILAAEIHVKKFMLRHRALLGISSEDVLVLQKMLGGY